MKLDATMGFIRHALTFGGGMLVTGGFLTTSELTGGTGAITTLIGLGWSIYDKWRKTR